ncbi:MAG: hypothetical protein LUG95_09010 [Clostridiales bacterium]|nr:hypothetical protein [Clostridiales bacterium]
MVPLCKGSFATAFCGKYREQKELAAVKICSVSVHKFWAPQLERAGNTAVSAVVD